MDLVTSAHVASHLPTSLTLLLLLLLAGCGIDEGRDSAVVRDEGPDLLYRDFIDGKMDGAGHPIGATVFEGESDCAPGTGWPAQDHLELDSRLDDPGRACEGETPELGRGPYVVNLRAALTTACDDGECGPLLEARAIGASGEVLGSASFESADFEEALSYQNLPLQFRLQQPQTVRIEVDFDGSGAVMLDYVEVFRQGRQLVLSPPSGVLEPGSDLRIEIVDPPDNHALQVRCDDVPLDDTFSAMLADGSAREELTDFRRILTVPTDQLLAACAEATQVVVELRAGTYTAATSELRYTSEPTPCAYEGDGETKVLITGFVPFPAGADQANSSMEGVLAFDPLSVPEASVMKMIIPVEFMSAPGLVEDAIARCAPDVVVGFGQGRNRVDLERTGYNRRDTSDVAGGFPDNRGLVVEPAPIRDDGPDVFSSELPIDEIEADLVAAGISVGQSDDPGRYVCNDHLYTVGTGTDAEHLTTGFVHMPYMRYVDAQSRQELATVVETVVRRTAEAHVSR